MSMWEGARENSESTEFAGVVKRYKKMILAHKIYRNIIDKFKEIKQ